MTTSLKVGTAYSRRGNFSVPVYEVREGQFVICHECRRVLYPLARFTRRGCPGEGSRRLPTCDRCLPFGEVTP